MRTLAQLALSVLVLQACGGTMEPVAATTMPRPRALRPPAADDDDERAPRCGDDPARAIPGAVLAFDGNATVGSDALACALARASQRDTPRSLADAQERGAFAERLVLLLQAAYYDRGYLEASASVAGTDWIATVDRALLRFTVREGERYRVRRVSVGEYDAHGTSVVPLGGRDALQGHVHLREGAWFSRSKAARTLLEISRAYREEGYARVEVEPDLSVHPGDHTVDVAIRVRRGPRVTVERVELRGNGATPRDALMARLRVRDGAVYRESDVDASRRALLDAGLARAVVVLTEAVPGRDDRLIVHFELQE